MIVDVSIRVPIQAKGRRLTLSIMAMETFTRLIDDLDGSDADSSVRLGLDGDEYTIDLSTKNADELRTKLGPYLEAARKVRPHAGRGGSRVRAVSDKRRNQMIRDWALGEGAEVNQRGRIAAVVIRAYEAQDGDMLREALGLELVEQKPSRRRRAPEPEFSAG